MPANTINTDSSQDKAGDRPEPVPPGHVWARFLSKNLFAQTEQIAYIGIGVLLIITAAISLAGVTLLLWQGVRDWSGTSEVFQIVDRLLFVLMLIEILHTVRVSTRLGGLAAEPFLIVGLIATIRRVLVITLETSQTIQGRAWSSQVADQFHASMIELGVLGGLILIMVASIYMLHRSGGVASTTGG